MVIATASAAQDAYDETASTLAFAQRATRVTARLRVDASELRRAAFEVERRRVTRSVAARVCLVASVVSGFVIVPELLAATSI